MSKIADIIRATIFVAFLSMVAYGVYLLSTDVTKNIQQEQTAIPQASNESPVVVSDSPEGLDKVPKDVRVLTLDSPCSEWLEQEPIDLILIFAARLRDAHPEYREALLKKPKDFILQVQELLLVTCDETSDSPEDVLDNFVRRTQSLLIPRNDDG